MNTLKSRIVILDDDTCENTLDAILFRKKFHPADLEVAGFTDVEEGLQYLATTCKDDIANTVFLLDVNLPVFDGWKVLERLAHLPLSVIRQLRVYMLSSTLHRGDRTMAEGHPLVKAYLAKPLSDHFDYLLPQFAEPEMRLSAYKRNIIGLAN